MKAELTKGDVYVVVDTPKKAKRLKKVLDVFGEKLYKTDEIAIATGSYPGSALLYNEFNKASFSSVWWSIHTSHFNKTKVSIKELRNILAKEHLKAGDYVVCEDGYDVSIVKIKSISEGRINVDKELFLDDMSVYTEGFEYICNFKRYATPEEIALLEPRNGLCSLCKSKLGIK